MKFLLLASNAFQYKLTSQEITAPEMFCFSGDATSQFRDRSLPCPTTPEEVANYPAVVMDEAGYVTVKIPNIIMRDDGRRRHDIQIRNEEDEAGYDNWNKKKGKGRNLKNRTEIIVVHRVRSLKIVISKERKYRFTKIPFDIQYLCRRNIVFCIGLRLFLLF